MATIVLREEMQYRVDVKPDQAEPAHRLFRLVDRHFAFRRLQLAPSLDDPLRMALPHGVHVLVGDGRRLDRRFQIERHQQRFDPGVREFADNVVLGLRGPAAIPVFGERVHVRALARDPFLGAGVAVQIDDSHAAPSRSSFAVTISTNAFFATLPKVDTGKYGRISSRSGSLNFAMSLSLRNSTSSFNLKLRPFFG